MYHKTEEEITRNWKGDIQTPVVSVCCATYNHEPFIEDAIKGFLMQETDFPFEILIRDDCSTDGTANIIRMYAKKYPTLIKPIFEQTNTYSQGIRPMPALYKIAQGEYIAVCEGDDYWTDPQKLQLQKDFLDRNPDFIMHTHAVITIDDTCHTMPYSPYYANPNRINTFNDILMHHFIPTLSLFFRKNKWPSSVPTFYTYIRSGDIATELILASQGKCYYEDRTMGAYRHHDGGITKKRKLTIEKTIEHHYALYHGVDAFLEYRFHSLISKKLALLEYGYFRHYLRQGSYLSALRMFMRMLRHDPLFIFKWVLMRSEFQ